MLSPLWRVPQTLLVSGEVRALLLLLEGRHSPLKEVWAGFPSWNSTAQDNGCGCRCLTITVRGNSRGDFSWQYPLPEPDMAAAL